MTSRSVVDTEVMTINRFVMENQRKTNSTGELTQLLNAILTCIKAVSEYVLTAGIDKQLNDTSGYDYLDKQANKLFINLLRSSFTTCLMVSKEAKNLIEVALKDQGKYVVCFDPIDGSANIDCLAPVGSIFCIYRRLPDPLPNSCVVGQPCPKIWPTIEDALQPGRNIVAGGYAVYGSSTVVVLSTGQGVNGFLLDPSIGEFVLCLPDIRIKQKGQWYSINEGHANTWDKAVTQYIHEKKFPKSGKPYMARYIGSMVADVHRVLMEGGIFLYPKIPQKLSLIYECNAMAYIIEQAGGKATTGDAWVLDVKPQALHQTTAIYLGSANDVDDVVTLFEKQKSAAKLAEKKFWQ